MGRSELPAAAPLAEPEAPLLSLRSPRVCKRSPDRGKYPFCVFLIGLAAPAWWVICLLASVAWFLFHQPGVGSWAMGLILILTLLIVAVVGALAVFVGVSLLLDEFPLLLTGVDLAISGSALSWAPAPGVPRERGETPPEAGSLPVDTILGGHLQLRSCTRFPLTRARDEERSVPVVVLQRADEEIFEIEARDLDEAEAALRALRLAADQRAASFALRTPPRSWATRAVASLAGALQLLSACVMCGFGWAEVAAAWLAARSGVESLAAWQGLAFASLVVWLVAWKLAPCAHEPSVVVGADGIGGKVPGRFVPWGQVDGIDDERGVALRRRGSPLSLRLRDGSAPAAEALARRCREALGRWQEAAAVATEAPHELAPSARSVDAWREALLAVAASRGPYRGDMSREVLYYFLVNPTTPRAPRVAAAVALAALDDEGRAQVRAAAGLFADPVLRRLLALVIDGLDRQALAAVASE